MTLSLIERALRIAAIAHKDQMRKEGDIPYIVHPVMVALDLKARGFGEEVVAAALVHDVLEDTEFSEIQMEEELGSRVMAIVRAVTNDDSFSWEEKKLKYIETVREAGAGAMAVATADKIHNAESLIVAHAEQGEGVWANFNAGREKKIWFEEAMLTMLEESWDDPLIERYAELVREIKALV